MINYIIIGLLAVVIILLIVLLFRKNNNLDIVDRLSILEKNVTKDLGDFKYDMSKDLKTDF